jgi:hypothetical protein
MLRLGFVMSFMATMFAGSVPADAVTLNFAGLDAAANESPLNYYDGGLGSLGSGPGPNYGITFSSNSMTGIPGDQPGGNTNTAAVPGSPPANVLFFLTGGASVMDVAAGFTTGFSFYYSAIYDQGAVTVWSGLDGTGTELADLTLPVTPSDLGTPPCIATSPGWSAGFCPWFPIGIAFPGTAESVDFSGSNDQIGFADITTNSVTPSIPEPSTWALMAIGFAGLGFAGFRSSIAGRVATVLA